MSAEAIPESGLNGVIVALTPGGVTPSWASRASVRSDIRSAALDVSPEELSEITGGAHGVVVEGAEAPLSLARRLYRVAPAAQVVLVAEDESVRQELERSMLFTPQIGEVWIVLRENIDHALLDRVLDVGSQRQRRIARAAQISRAFQSIDPPTARRRFLPDRYLAGLLELLPGPVLALDEQGNVIYANPAASALLGTAPGAFLNRSELRERLAPVDPLPLDRLLHRELRGRETLQFESRANGEPRFLELEIAPISGERPLRALAFHDITERVRTMEQLEKQAQELDQQAEGLASRNRELQTQAEELQRLMAERSRFYANMSHELRTPINAVIGYSQLLEEEIYGELADAQHKAIDRVQSSASHLLDLVNDILDLSKIEAGKIDIQIEPVEMKAFLEDLESTLKPMAMSHESELRMRYAEEVPDAFPSDPRRLRQIIMNLISNAVRFGAGRPVEVECFRGKTELVVRVSDQGAGIPEDALDRIFEEFVQLGQEEGGTGLGLPIARSLARLLGGELSVKSKVGAGTTFALRLPEVRTTG